MSITPNLDSFLKPLIERPYANAENNEECLNKTINWSFDDNGVPLEFENVNLPSLNKETVYLKESKCHVKDEAFMLDYSV